MFSVPGTPVATSTPKFSNKRKLLFENFQEDHATLTATTPAAKANSTPYRTAKAVRPVSAPPFPSARKTIPIDDTTPRYARPTKSWLSYIQPSAEENIEVTGKKNKKTMSRDERRNIWKRLWACQGVGRAIEA